MNSKKWVIVAVAAGISISAILLRASTATVLGVGTLSYSDAIQGPTDVTFRQFTSNPGEVGPWHIHDGTVYNVVTAGAITIEDGCGGEQTYTAGQGWEQSDHRVHRWKNLGNDVEAELNTFIVPQGSPTTNFLPGQECGPPVNVTECRRGGWMSFDFPSKFATEADCVEYVRKHY